MQCPWCHHEQRLAWAVYFRSPLARFTCPVCGKRFRLQRSPAYLRMLTVATVTFVGVPLAATYLVTGSWFWAGVVAVAGAVGCALPFDRWLDDRFRRSRKVPDHEAGG